MICPHCHTDNRDGAKFCNECGFPLTGRIAESEVANAKLDDAHAAEAAEPVEEVIEDEPAAQRVDKPHPEVVLPTIDVRGLNVDDEGKPFDFDGDYEDQADEDPASESEEAETAPEPESDAPADDRHTDGLDVESDEEFDFEPLPDEEPLEEGEPEEAPDDVNPQVSSSDETRELTPVSTGGLWQAGATMEMPRVGEEASSGGYRAPDEDLTKKPRKKGRIIAVVIVLFAVVAAAVAFATYSMELWGGKAVPNVVGMTQADATDALSNDGFTVRTMEVRSDGTEGLVLLTDPSAGSRVEEGAQIVMHVAVARTIPEIVGLGQDEALKLLDEAGYTKISVQREKSNEPEGTVLSVDPEQGKRAAGSSQVTVVIAEPYTVPDVVYQDSDAAQAALEAEGYVVTFSRVYTENVPEGQVVSTDPVAGTQLNSGETVTVHVATSRATEVVSAAYGILWAGAEVNVDGVNYLVNSVDAMQYQGNDTVAYTFTGTPYTYFLGVRIELDATSVSGTITFNDDNTVMSSAPTLTVQ